MTAIAKVFGNYSVKNGGVIVPTESVTPETNLREAIRAASGQFQPTFAAAMGADPTIGVVSPDVANAYAALGATVVGSALATGTAAFIAGYQQLAADGTRDTGATAYTVTAERGIIVPTTIGASQGEVATIGHTVFPRSSDGQAVPWVTADEQTLADASSVAELFTAGPIKLGAAFIDGIQESVFDFGLGVEGQAADGQPYPTHYHVNTQNPGATATGFDLAQLLATKLGIPGRTVTTSSIVYFRQIQEGLQPYPDASSEHIKITMVQSRASLVEVPAAQGQPATIALRITPTWNGTNPIVQVAVDQAIT